MRKGLKYAVALMAIAVMPSGAAAQELNDEQAAKVAQTRQAVLKVVGWSIGPMGAMVRGLVPWDGEAFALRARRIASMTTMISDAFRLDTSAFELKTEALPVIWEDFAEFEALAANAEASSARLAEVAGGGDEAAAREAFGAMVDDCRACHDRFRVKRD